MSESAERFLFRDPQRGKFFLTEPLDEESVRKMFRQAVKSYVWPSDEVPYIEDLSEVQALCLELWRGGVDVDVDGRVVGNNPTRLLTGADVIGRH